MKAYKLFRTKNGKLYPLYVNANEETKMNEWLQAKCGPMTEKGKVKSKLGELCYRPGWHLAEFPIATHIGKRMEDGTLAMNSDTVWCEVEVSDAIDYQMEANDNGKNKHGNIIVRNAYLKHVPENGFYWYTTNTQAVCRWLIAGSIKVVRQLSNTEVEAICKANGLVPQKVA